MKRYLLSRKMLGNVVILGLLGIWFALLGPTAFGGPAGYIEVSGHSMDGTYKTGDLILTRDQDTYAKGDIVTFKVYDGAGQVIHRITGGNGDTGYTTQGDNNPDPDPWHPTDEEIVGKSWVRFEGKAWVLHLPQRPWFVGAAAGLITLLVLGLDGKPRKRRSDEEPVEPVADEGLVPEPQDLPGTTPKVPAQRTDSTPAVAPELVPLHSAEGRLMQARFVPAWAFALLAAFLLVPALVQRPAAATQLQVTAAPIQTWKIDHGLPELADLGVDLSDVRRSRGLRRDRRRHRRRRRALRRPGPTDPGRTRRGRPHPWREPRRLPARWSGRRPARRGQRQGRARRR